jgi:hypothetical protein
MQPSIKSLFALVLVGELTYDTEAIHASDKVCEQLQAAVDYEREERDKKRMFRRKLKKFHHFLSIGFE